MKNSKVSPKWRKSLSRKDKKMKKEKQEAKASPGESKRYKKGVSKRLEILIVFYCGTL